MPVNPRSLLDLKRGTQRQPLFPAAPEASIQQAPDISFADIGAEGVANPAFTADGPARAADRLRQLTPQAVELLSRIISGAIRSQPSVRVAAARTVLESQGLLVQQVKRPAVDDPGM